MTTEGGTLLGLVVKLSNSVSVSHALSTKGVIVTVSELAKRCFAIMTKIGDIEVIGDFEVVNRQMILMTPPVGFDKEDSEVLPKAMQNEKGENTSLYL